MRYFKRALGGIVRSNWFLIAAVLLAAVVLMLALAYGVLDYYLRHAEGVNAYSAMQDAAKLGTLGDFFGGVLNPVFGFLSFVGLLVAVILQREQLVELKLEAIEHSKAADKKAFEDTFFQMLRLHQEVLASIELADHEGSYRGRAVIERVFTESFSDYDFLDTCQRWEDREDFLAWLNAYYDDNYIRFAHLVEHYFQSIENLAMFLFNSQIRNKSFYARLLRGQFSQHEMQMLFFHALREESYLLKDYIEDLGLFEALNFDNLPDYSLLSLYEASAYGLGLSKWVSARTGKFSRRLSPSAAVRAGQAVREMLSASQDRLASMKLRLKDARAEGVVDEACASQAARLEVEVSRLARLHRSLAPEAGRLSAEA